MARAAFAGLEEYCCDRKILDEWSHGRFYSVMPGDHWSGRGQCPSVFQVRLIFLQLHCMRLEARND